MTDFNLAAAFAVKQTQLLADLGAAEAVGHPDDKGDISEGSWRKMLAKLLPTRYGVSQATVVDCLGGKSDAIDVVIHDRHFSPLVFWQDDVMYVPAESVYAVFECKPAMNKALLAYGSAKADSVRRLHRTAAQIVHAGGRILEPKKPPTILAGYLATRSDWTPPLGGAFEKHLAVDGGGRIDLGCVVGAGAWEVPSDTADPLSVVSQDKSLVFFAMRLLARLQDMGTISAMDYNAWSTSLID
jgi:hypothetical protein